MTTRDTARLWDFQSRSILRNLNEVCERLAALEAVGVTVPLYQAQAARDALLMVVVKDAEAEMLEPSEAIEPPGADTNHVPSDPVSISSAMELDRGTERAITS